MQRVADILGIIPARYASSRFPGKPLAMIKGKPMIRWVYERATGHLEHLVVATDDHRIMEAVEQFGGHVVMTSGEHRSGTERCAEGLRLYELQVNRQFSHVVNIQGDEPLIRKEQLKELTDSMEDPAVQIATLVRPMQQEDRPGDPNLVKVVVDRSFRALYFSRSVIPYHRKDPRKKTPPGQPYFKHMGIYGYRSDVLEKIAALPPSPLEIMESLEQLRWMEHGFRIQTRITRYSSLGVDTPEDLERIRSHF
ncbi:MAG: 3-deoxy-manno-octulosonate cytidylyltransferase [Bacteroidales bacterium]